LVSGEAGRLSDGPRVHLVAFDLKSLRFSGVAHR
jgi:hypothetical protein